MGLLFLHENRSKGLWYFDLLFSPVVCSFELLIFLRIFVFFCWVTARYARSGPWLQHCCYVDACFSELVLYVLTILMGSVGSLSAEFQLRVLRLSICAMCSHFVIFILKLRRFLWNDDRNVVISRPALTDALWNCLNYTSGQWWKVICYQLNTFTGCVII